MFLSLKRAGLPLPKLKRTNDATYDFIIRYLDVVGQLLETGRRNEAIEAARRFSFGYTSLAPPPASLERGSPKAQEPTPLP